MSLDMARCPNLFPHPEHQHQTMRARSGWGVRPTVLSRRCPGIAEPPKPAQVDAIVDAVTPLLAAEYERGFAAGQAAQLDLAGVLTDVNGHGVVKIDGAWHFMHNRFVAKPIAPLTQAAEVAARAPLPAPDELCRADGKPRCLKGTEGCDFPVCAPVATSPASPPACICIRDINGEADFGWKPTRECQAHPEEKR